MSNATDILLLTGPKAGVLFCAPRPVAPKLEVTISPTHSEFYVPEPWTHPDNAKRYWVAVRAEDAMPGDLSIISMVEAHGMQPSWDLNR